MEPITSTITTEVDKPQTLGSLTLHVHFSANDAYSNKIANLEDLKPLYPITFGKKNYTIPAFQKDMSTYLKKVLASDTQPDQQGKSSQEIKSSYSTNEEAFDVAMKILLGFQNVEINQSSFFDFYLILQELGIPIDRKSYPSQNPKFYEDLENMLAAYLKSNLTKEESIKLMSFALSKQRDDLILLCHKAKGFKNLVLEILNSKDTVLTEEQFVYILKYQSKTKTATDDAESCISTEDVIQIIMKYPSMDLDQKMSSISNAFTEIKNQYEGKIKALEVENQAIKENSNKAIEELKAKCTQYETTIHTMGTEVRRPPERMQSPGKTVEKSAANPRATDAKSADASDPNGFSINLVYFTGAFGKKMVDVIKNVINQVKDKSKGLNISFTGDHKDYYAFLKTPEGKKDTHKKVLYLKSITDTKLVDDQFEESFLKTASPNLYAGFYAEGSKKPGWKENEIPNTVLKLFTFGGANGQYDIHPKSKEDFISNLKKYIL